MYGLLLKITGISILVQYAVTLCKDSGETAIANKIDLGGKVIIISLSIPIISASLTMLLELLP
ncbi:MAG: stage III sporulation AC/AD family protein [Clostridia bacterium]|nr:stage III sporulation AC/AD family protein [Clostridia bacterium]